MSTKIKEIPLFTNVSTDYFTNTIHPKHHPALLRGVDIGDCTDKWTHQYLSEKVGDVNVKIHVTVEPQMDFIQKNFKYKTLPFNELVNRAATKANNDYFFHADELYYLRSLGLDPRGREVADITKQFPSLADDIKIPQYFEEGDFFSSVFRIGSPGVQLWTHYDVMDNILIQIKGRKRMVLYSPGEALNMYLVGDKSLVLDIDNPDLDKYPKFTLAERHECIMEPGDILYIPALWFHNTLALEFSVAVNVFWKNLQHELYHKNDPYGNKDLVPATRALQMVDKACKRLESLPYEYKDFYGKRMIAELESRISEWQQILNS